MRETIMRLGRSAIMAAILALVPAAGFAEDQKTYKLTIGDVVVDIDPGETLDVTMPDGKQTKVTLALNDFATFSGDIFSFVHPTNVAVTKTELDPNIQQYLMASALGTLVIIQEYSAMNPTSLNPLMLQELTKESVQAGGELSQDTTSRTLADGTQISGLKATVKTKSDTTNFEILSIGATDQGVLMVTRVDEGNAATEGAMIDKFWASLKIKM
jgi:hypothetical protein